MSITIAELKKRLALAEMIVNAAIEFGSSERVVKEYTRQHSVIKQVLNDRQGGLGPEKKSEGKNQVVNLKNLTLHVRAPGRR